MTLRRFGLGKNSMEERIHGEIKYIIDTLEKSIGKSMSPQVMFHNAASNIICQVLFGTRYEYDDEFIKVIVQCFTENAKLANGPWAMGTLIIPNMISVLSEEGQWKYPNEFNPENFLNDQGEFVKPEAFMPFSAGPRTCLGEGLARMELFLVLVTLLRKFKFIWPEDAGEPDYTPVYGVTLTPKPYHMKVQLREMQ